MVDIALVSANKVEIVESREQHTAPCGVNITAGQAVQIDGTTGRWALATTAKAYGVATRTARAGEPLTALAAGVMDGFVLDALAYDADVFANPANGNLASGAGTPSVIMGRVMPAYATLLGVAHDKLLRVETRRA